MAFFEIRQYQIRPGKMDEWVDFMQTTIIPFQVSKGMVICGSYRGEEDDSVYFWIRRFESEADRQRLYDAVYKSDEWLNTMTDRVGELIDRETIIVNRVVATSLSTMQ
ncbi:NIPSNAP family containing protein [Chromatiales bacterium (ex Bugula neritina AB1)]|nr:NIPSNAP family containing protein [Chromatiales bacterium (ex Bugula neritina AB1)]